MRKITKEASRAFFNRKKFKKNNTQVIPLSNGDVSLYLFNTLIAWTINGIIYFSMRGFNTVTTRERLRGLGIFITTHYGTLFLDNDLIDCWSEYKTKLCLNNRPDFL